MGTQIKDIVSVNITRETARLTQVGFGEFLFLTEVSEFYDRVKTYSEPKDLLDDGFTTSSEAYIAALSAYSQELSPTSFKVGRKYADVNALQKFTFNALATGGTFKITLGAETTAAIPYNATAADIKAAIELLTAVTAVTVVGAMPVLSFTVEFTGADAKKHFSTMSVDVSLLTSVATGTVSVLQYGSAAETWAEALTACIAFNLDWYALTASTRTKADILALAAIIEAEDSPPKMYFTCTDDADVLTSVSTDVASELAALNYDKASYFWSADEAKYPECAWIGLQLPKNPGSTNWKFQQLKGITADSFTTTQLGYLKAKKANYFEKIAGLSIVSSEGVVASGEYVDIIHGTDWLQVRMAERVFIRLIRADKVPFTNPGGAILENEVRAQLDQASSPAFALLVKESILVNVPLVKDIDPADKANRYFNGITFSADYQGAVNKVGISGRLSF